MTEYTNRFENLFIRTLSERTYVNTSFLQLPSNNSFTGCVKEILNCLKKEINGIINSDNSNVLIANFYNWLSSENLIKEYDYLFYCQLLQTLKQYSEGQKVSKTEKYAFFEYVNKSKIHKYRFSLYNRITLCFDNDSCDDKTYEYINLFINELLAVGTSYQFLRFVYKCYKENKFQSFKDFISYIFFGNMDSLDIYIPISNYQIADNELFDIKKQKIEKIEEKYYCKVYDNNTMDFYFIIRENIVRIDSLFNILRFYNNSQISFDFNDYIIINSKYFGEEFKISMRDIMFYRSKHYGQKYLKSSVEALEKLKSIEKESYHKILNVISYAEKDQDILNSSSYVDNWISLETLTSMSGRNKGFESVKQLIPKLLSVKVIFDDAYCKFALIKKNLIKYDIKLNKLEDFIKLAHDNSFNYSLIKDDYIRIITERLAKRFSSISLFKKYIDYVENSLSIDLLRIYVLRNEYVHTSNIQAFSSMQHFKLKHILSATIDEFFRILDNRIDKDVSDYGIVFDAFSEVINKYEIRKTAFSSLTETQKLLNGKVVLNTNLEEQKISYETFVFNVLINNTSLFRKYDMD